MKPLFSAIRDQWRRNKWFRVWTILASIGLALYIISTLAWSLGALEVEGMPAANDLQVYIDASQRFLAHQALYIPPHKDFAVYVYSPAYALFFSPLIHLPYSFLVISGTLIQLGFYFLLYWCWHEIFRRNGLTDAADALIRLFPLWLIFSGFLYEILYLNIYVPMALVASLLLKAIMEKKLGLSILWLAILLPIKPQWAFAAGIPLLMKQWRFLGKLILGSILAYAAIAGITMIIGGSYAVNQYVVYSRFLGTIPGSFYWNTLSVEGHIGYNNSIMQLVKFFSDNAAYSVSLTTIFKAVSVLPILGLAVFFLRRRRIEEKPTVSIELAFALYLAAFFWLDVMTELTLSIVIFTYIIGTSNSRWEKIAVSVIFLPHAISLIYSTLTTIVSFAVTIPDWLVDPSLFIPVITLAQAGLYALVLIRLFKMVMPARIAEQETARRPLETSMP